MAKEKIKRGEYNREYYIKNANKFKKQRLLKIKSMTEDEREQSREQQRKYYLDNKDVFKKRNKKRYNQLKDKLKKLTKLENMVRDTNA